MITEFNSLVRHVASYAIHFALVFVVAWAANHGFHISVPVIPASLGTWSVFGLIRLLTHNVGRSLALGKLQAQIEAAGKTFVSAVVDDVTQAAEGK